MHKTVNTHHLLIQTLQERGLLKDYAYFLKFKYLFSSSQLNKGNRAKLSRLTGVSDKTVRVKIAKFIRMGWIRKDAGGNFVFIKLSKLYRNYYLPHSKSQRTCKIVLGQTDKVREIKIKLASKLLEANLLRQEYVLKLKHEAVSSPEKSGLLWSKDRNLLHNYRNNLKNVKGLKKRENAKTVLSCKSFGRMLGLSTSSGHAIKSEMVRLNLITCEPQSKVFRKNFTLELWNARKSELRKHRRNLYYAVGCVWEITADYIQMLPLPLSNDLYCLNRNLNEY